MSDPHAPHPVYAAEAQTAAPLPETIVERVSRWLCGVGMLAMVATVVVELVTRNLMGFSFEMSDELGGYIVVAVAFLSLCVCEIHRSYHRMEIVQSRLPRRAQAASRIFFDVVILAFCVLLVWQLGRFVLNNWHSGDVAPTHWMTPLWIPQASMPIGAVFLTWSVLRSLRADLAAFRRGDGTGEPERRKASAEDLGSGL